MRIIATILCSGNQVIQTYGFKSRKSIGSPQVTVKHLDLWEVDEIVVLQIDNSFEDLISNVKSIASVSTTPITAGGGITSLNKASQVISSGADRLCMQSIMLINYPDLVECAKTFGGQAITLKFDFSMFENSLRSFGCNWESFISCWGQKILDLADHDIDELFFNSVDADGLISPAVFPYINSGIFSSHSVVLGGGISHINVVKLFNQFSPFFKDISFSLSNLFYQKEIANKAVLHALSKTNGKHRFLEVS